MVSEVDFSCLLCGEKTHLSSDKHIGYQKSQFFQIYTCPFCKTSFSTPRVDASYIYDNIYLNGKNVPGYRRYWKYIQLASSSKKPLDKLSEVEETYWSVKTALSNHIKDKKSAKILEIGSGLGYLTYSLYREGYDVLGIDLSKAAVSQAEKSFGNHYLCADIFDFVRGNESAYDVVVMTEVIEHVENPQAFMLAIKQLLKHNGLAIITTPNKSFYPEDIVWGTELPPVHCWWFSETSMNFMAKQLGMSVSFLDFKGFYRKHPLVVRTDVLRNGQLHCVKLDENGQLLDEINNRQNNPLRKLRSCIYSIGWIKNAYNVLMARCSRSGLVCGKKGQIICALYRK
jgi:SAM-dependent methyltransferase